MYGMLAYRPPTSRDAEKGRWAMTLTVGDLKQLQKETMQCATPHRTVNWKALREPNDTEVEGFLVFLEEYNTGYPGALERYAFTANGKRFYMDVLPGKLGRDGA